MNKGLYYFVLLSTVMLLAPSLLSANAPVNATSHHEQDKDSFTQGLKAFDKKEYAQAVENFRKELENQPQNYSALINLGLAHYKLGQWGFSLAAFRKAQALRPGDEAATQGLSVLQRLPQLQSALQTDSLYEMVRAWALVPFSTSFLAFVAILTSSLTLYLFGRHWQRQKQAQAEEQAKPATPWQAFVLAAIAALFFFFCILKIYDLRQTRATVTVNRAPLNLSPDKQSPSINEIVEGQDLRVKATKSGMLHVEIPGGPSGWVDPASVMVTQQGVLE